jgi:hypothetical protein
MAGVAWGLATPLVLVVVHGENFRLSCLVRVGLLGEKESHVPHIYTQESREVYAKK